MIGKKLNKVIKSFGYGTNREEVDGKLWDIENIGWGHGGSRFSIPFFGDETRVSVNDCDSFRIGEILEARKER